MNYIRAGEKVKIRLLEEKDLDERTVYCSDKETGILMGVPAEEYDRESTWEEERKKMDEWHGRRKSHKNVILFAIDTLDGEFIGDMDFSIDDCENKIGSFTIVIYKKQYREKGYGTDAMRIFLDYVLNELKMNKLKVECLLFNKRIINLNKRFGFIETKTDNKLVYMEKTR